MGRLQIGISFVAALAVTALAGAATSRAPRTAKAPGRTAHSWSESTPCPAARSLCVDQRDFNGPRSVCQVFRLDGRKEVLGRELARRLTLRDSA